MESKQAIDNVPETLLEAVRYFSDPETCVRFVAELRWPDGIACPYCGAKEPGYISTRRIFKCKNRECRKQFSVKVGTIFEDSPLGLDKWLVAMWMLANCKNGISSYEIHRAIGITQKSAWFMLHRIRVAMQTGTFERLEGTVEADETFIGGLEKNKHTNKKLNAGRGIVGKAVVMGILERGDGDKKSRVKTSIIPNTKSESLHGEIKSAVAEGSTLMTDAARGYNGLESEYIRGVVDHAVKYVEGKVHTNGLENFWSLTKRTLKGTYVSVEPGHLIAYLDEQTFRFNERGMKDNGRFLMVLAQVAGKRLTYRELIGNPQGIESPDPLRGGPRAD